MKLNACSCGLFGSCPSHLRCPENLAAAEEGINKLDFVATSSTREFRIYDMEDEIHIALRDNGNFFKTFALNFEKVEELRDWLNKWLEIR